MKALIAAILCISFCGAASAQQLLPIVVSSCGTPASTYTPGQPASQTMDTTGRVCSSVTGSGLDQSLSVMGAANPQFFDAFSTTLDTGINWTISTSGGTAATAAGVLNIASSTTASAWGGLSSKRLFAPSGSSEQIFGATYNFANSTIANTVRYFGVGTVPATPTTVAPITDGYFFRLDGTGALFAEIWANGTAVSSTNVTTACKAADGSAATGGIAYRSNFVAFYCSTTAAAPTTAAVYLNSNPQNQTLPVSAFSVAAASAPGSSATIALSAITLVSNPPAAVVPAGQAANANDPSLVVQLSPNSGVSSFSRIPSSANTTNLTNAKATAGKLLKIYGCNTTASAVFIKFYNVASATVGTTPVYFSREMPANQCSSYDVSDIGWYFSTAISYAYTGATADSDTTVITAGAIVQSSVEFQ